MNVVNLLANAARAIPTHPALIFEGHPYSYAALDRLSAQFAHAIGGRGLKRGDVLAIFLESCPELVIAYLGALRAGVTPNVVNGFLQPEEVRRQQNNLFAGGERVVVILTVAEPHQRP